VGKKKKGWESRDAEADLSAILLASLRCAAKD
jgi:hypothetical protein